MLRLDYDTLLLPDVQLRRVVSRRLAALTWSHSLGAWFFGDTHAHLVWFGPPEQIVDGTRRVQLILQALQRPGVRFLPPRYKWFHDQGHRSNTTHYCLSQADGHGLTQDPFGDGDCRVDLLGFRVIASGLASRVRRFVPRLADSFVAERLGVTLDEVTAWSQPLPEGACEHLVDAAAAALGLGSLRDNRPGAVLARAAAVHACRADVPSGAIADALGISLRTGQRIRRGGADPSAVMAVRRQACWRRREAERGGLATEVGGPAASPPGSVARSGARPPG